MYSAVKLVLGFVARLLFRVKVEAKENVPLCGPIVLCANHISWWDPVLVAASTPRPIHFMAKEELFKYPFMGYLLLKIHAFPVRRGKADLGAIRSSLAVLKDGHILGIFPEGTRQRGEAVLGEMHAGAAMLALRSDSPVIPVAIRGPYGFRKRVTIAYGEPFRLEAKTGRTSLDMHEGAKTIASAISQIWGRLGDGAA